MACLSRKRTDWFFRMKQEAKHHEKSCFVTLTYDTPYLEYSDKGFPQVSKRHCQLFLKRLRKASPIKIRYYLGAEYCPTSFRPHYHAIIFGLGVEDTEMIRKAWNMGFITNYPATDADINYCAKYVVVKAFTPAGVRPTFSLMSRKPGLGADYLDDGKRYHVESEVPHFTARLEGGAHILLPKYYRDRMFTEEQRAAHADEVREKFRKQGDAQYRRLFFKKYGKTIDEYRLEQAADYERLVKEKVTKTCLVDYEHLYQRPDQETKADAIQNAAQPENVYVDG